MVQEEGDCGGDVQGRVRRDGVVVRPVFSVVVSIDKTVRWCWWKKHSRGEDSGEQVWASCRF